MKRSERGSGPARFGLRIPLGRVEVEVNAQGFIARVELLAEGEDDGHEACETFGDARARELGRVLEAWLEGKSETMPLDRFDLSRCSPFQCRVLEAQCRVPRGRVTTYGALAAAVGKPWAARAVGRVLAANPFPLFVPCHRTVRADGGLGGFGGGVPMKRALLAMEGVQFDRRGRVRPEFIVRELETIRDLVTGGKS